MATNPAVSMPNSNFIADALKACPFVAVSDVTASTETARYAHVLLPAQGWGEKDGTVTNTERCISRQRRFAEPAGEARADWQIMADVAKAMGFNGFDHSAPSEIFAEHVQLTTIANEGKRKLDLADWQFQDYDTLAPRQWGGAQPFADGMFQTPNGRARFVPTRYEAIQRGGLTLNTGRIRDQWHTMTRTGLVPRLFGHRAEPHVEMSSNDAKRRNIDAASLVEIQGIWGKTLARALLSDVAKSGEIFLPMHWSSSFANNALANANSPSLCDPISGQPALKSAQVSVRPYQAAWYGYGVSIHPVASSTDYFAVRPLNNGMAFECADKALPNKWSQFVVELFPQAEISSFLHGSHPAHYRCIALKDEDLAFAFFASDKPIRASREWLQQQLGKAVDPMEILPGRPAEAGEDKGPILCACMNVGRNDISRFIGNTPGAALNAVCGATGAGTGCGSCRIEVQRMIIEKARPAFAAE
jgi:assimilatory nitrate reductase catalytic subunit